MKKKIVITALWLLIVYILKHYKFLALDMSTLKTLITGQTYTAMIIFIGLWVVRLLTMIPGVTLMVLGGICFDPFLGFLLSMIGMVLSETIIFILSKSYFRNKIARYLEEKYPEVKSLLETHNIKFLALGIICPVAPTDIICYFSGTLGLKYWKYILTIVISNIPMMLLYSYVGISLRDSILGSILVVVSLGLVLAITIKMWNKLKEKTEIQQYC